MSFLVELYEKEDKTIPFKDFITSLPKQLVAKVLRDLDLLETFGNNLREPYSAPLGNGLFELRTKQGSNIVRLIYFFVVGNRIIITHGFLKKTEKTPVQEIYRARKYKQDWIRRHSSELQRI